MEPINSFSRRQVVTVPKRTSSASMSFENLVKQLGLNIVIEGDYFADIELPENWRFVLGDNTGSSVDRIDYIVDESKYRRVRVYTHCFDILKSNIEIVKRFKSKSNIEIVKRFKWIVQSQPSTNTVCPFLDMLVILDMFTTEVVYQSLPYSLSKKDGELYQKWKTEKPKLLKWFSDRYPNETLYQD